MENCCGPVEKWPSAHIRELKLEFATVHEVKDIKVSPSKSEIMVLSWKRVEGPFYVWHKGEFEYNGVYFTREGKIEQYFSLVQYLQFLPVCSTEERTESEGKTFHFAGNLHSTPGLWLKVWDSTCKLLKWVSSLEWMGYPMESSAISERFKVESQLLHIETVKVVWASSEIVSPRMCLGHAQLGSIFRAGQGNTLNFSAGTMTPEYCPRRTKGSGHFFCLSDLLG